MRRDDPGPYDLARLAGLPMPALFEADATVLTARYKAWFEAETGRTLYPMQVEMLLIEALAYAMSLLGHPHSAPHHRFRDRAPDTDHRPELEQPMSLETSITALTAQGGLMMDLPQQFAAMANQKFVENNNWWMGRQTAMFSTLHVDPVSGVDSAQGTAAAPLKTVQKAVDLVPVGGLGLINLLGPINLAAHITIRNRVITLQSSSSIRHNVTFERNSVASGANTIRRNYSFRLEGNASINLIGLTIKVPLMDGSYGTFISDGNDYLIGFNGFASFGAQSACIFWCDVDMPANNFCNILCDGVPISFELFGVTATNQSLLGKMVRGVTNTAGTPSNTLPWLKTNQGNV